MQKMPQARRSGLIVKEVDGETLIYDRELNKAHCLNQTAASVWKYCDGETTMSEATIALARDLGTSVDEELVRYAVDQFSRDNLLEKVTVPPAFVIAGMNRRQLVRTLGLAAVVAIPVVTSIVAPTPAQAASPLPNGSACTESAQCQSNFCNGAPNGVCA
ncbi:MAG: PqqD family protein [Pyrinomonadaceae bacterium]|nr:PqqD family protein [Pyrinomonadaceae bacterium]